MTELVDPQGRVGRVREVALELFVELAADLGRELPKVLLDRVGDDDLSKGRLFDREGSSGPDPFEATDCATRKLVSTRTLTLIELLLVLYRVAAQTD